MFVQQFKIPFMKITTVLFFSFLTAVPGFAQTLSFQLDTTQNFQDADVGAMAFADVDNDGDNDYLVTGKGGPVLTTLYLNDGSGNFTAQSNSPFVNVFGGDVKFFDADNDNDVDVFITGSTSAPLRTANLYLNNGSGNFSLVSGGSIEALSSSKLDVGDVDNDGDIDVVILGTNSAGDAVTKVYANNGSGIFTELSGSSITSLQFGSPRFIDIEKDGDLDLVICGEDNSGNPLTSIYNNNGSGIFTLNSASTIFGLSSSDIAVGDVDNDGDDDLIECGINGSSISTKLYLNNGSGVFSELTGVPFAPVFVGAVKLADFDNDGDLDVYVMGSGPGGGAAVVTKIYSNLGANNYVEMASLAGAYLSSVAIGDVNGDNALDVILSGTSFTMPSRATRLYLNTTVGLTVNENQVATHFYVYPNPTNDRISIEVNEKVKCVSILNIQGVELLRLENSSSNIQLDLSQFAPGNYIVRSESSAGVGQKKIIKY